MLLWLCLDSLGGVYYVFLDRIECIGLRFDWLLVMLVIGWVLRFGLAWS